MRLWVLQVRDCKKMIRCTASRNSKGCIALLAESKPTIPRATSTSSPTISVVIPASRPVFGWSIIPASSRVHSHSCVLAQSAGGLVAALPLRCACRPELCQSQADRASHPCRHCSALCSRKALGLRTLLKDCSRLFCYPI